MLDLTKINKKGTESKISNSSVGTITIVSARSHIASGLSTQARMNGNLDIKLVNCFFNDIVNDEDIASSDYVIIDIEDYREIFEIEQKIKYLLPVRTKKIFVGDIDSISFCDGMKRIGATYLHLDSQMMMLGEVLKKVGDSNEVTSYTQKMSVLGCKGGSGTSLVTWRLFQAFGELSSLPTLLVQGHTGTPDLDLLSDITLHRDGVITQINTHQGMKIATDEEQWQFDAPDYQNYNIVIFDHNVTTQVRDKLAYIAPGSDFIFIVVTRELSSVRNARLVIDELERTSTNQDSAKDTSKNIIVLNENHATKPDELTNEDIENYLGKRIDIVNPYTKDLKKDKMKSELYFFAAKMLGKKVKEDKSGKVKKSLSLPTLFRKK